MNNPKLLKLIRNKFVYGLCRGDKNCTSEVNALLNEAKKQGVGIEKNQALFYLEKDYDLINYISNFWLSITRTEIKNHRTSSETHKVFKRMIRSFKTGNPIKFVLILCPAYKKGPGEYGFKENPGKTTGQLIAYLNEIIALAKANNLKASGEIWFSDLLVENYQKMDKKYVSDSLERNYKQIKDMVGKIRNIRTRRLSQVGSLALNIGIAGKKTFNHIPKQIIERVKNRSSVFYFEILGWGKKEVDDRIKILAPAYELIGMELNQIDDAIMIFGEKNLERGKMYSGDQSDTNCVPIIYPKLEEL